MAKAERSTPEDLKRKKKVYSQIWNRCTDLNETIDVKCLNVQNMTCGKRSSCKKNHFVLGCFVEQETQHLVADIFTTDEYATSRQVAIEKKS